MSEPLRDAVVLATGASGFIGRHLSARLARAGAQVHATSRSGPLAGRDAASGDRGVEWHRLDLGDDAAVRTLVARVKPDVVFHLAGLVKGSRDRALVLPALEANLAATVRLLDAVAEHGSSRFVQIGSLEEPPIDQPPQPPASPYAAAKAAATAYCRMYAELYGLPVVIARVFMVYGPGPQDRGKLVPYVIRTLLDGGTPRLSSGTRAVDWVYVEDVAEGLARIASADRVAGQVIDLGSGELVTVADVVRRLYRLAARDDEPRFGSLDDRRLEQIRRADVAATRAALGWAPGVDLDSGLRRTLDWFRREAGHDG
ncbi:MAG TPA: NAD(P)-dependent oxidoreductase [Thermoanaerobaculia bacterium]|nr:NAD(P)-dependent oxidoreductase [Thermoanaerobaculia bacterium]